MGSPQRRTPTGFSQAGTAVQLCQNSWNVATREPRVPGSGRGDVSRGWKRKARSKKKEAGQEDRFGRGVAPGGHLWGSATGRSGRLRAAPSRTGQDRRARDTGKDRAHCAGHGSPARSSRAKESAGPGPATESGGPGPATQAQTWTFLATLQQEARSLPGGWGWGCEEEGPWPVSSPGRPGLKPGVVVVLVLVVLVVLGAGLRTLPSHWTSVGLKGSLQLSQPAVTQRPPPYCAPCPPGVQSAWQGPDTRWPFGPHPGAMRAPPGQELAGWLLPAGGSNRGSGKGGPASLVGLPGQGRKVTPDPLALLFTPVRHQPLVRFWPAASGLAPAQMAAGAMP